MVAQRQEAARHGSPVLLKRVNQAGPTLVFMGLDPGFRSSSSPAVLPPAAAGTGFCGSDETHGVAWPILCVCVWEQRD